MNEIETKEIDLLAEIVQLKHQIDEMDKVIGKQRAAIIVQSRMMNSIQHNHLLFELAVEGLCNAVLTDQNANAIRIAVSLQSTLRRPEPTEQPKRQPLSNKLTFPPEPQLDQEPEERNRSSIVLPIDSTSTYLEPAKKASEPTI